MSFTHPFTLLKSNVKGFIETTLEPCTAFVGENRTGKTAYLDSVRVALTGKHPVGHHNKNLLELAAPGAGMLFARLEGPAGTAALQVESSGDSAPEFSGMLAELSAEERGNLLPALSMHELLAPSAAKSREAIFRRFGEVKEITMPVALREDQQELWKEGLAEVSEEGLDPAETLSALSAWMRSRKLAAGRKHGALKRKLDGADPAEQAGSELLEDYEKDYVKAVAWENASAAREALREARDRLGGLKRRLGELGNERKPLVEEKERLGGLSEEVEARYAELDAEVEAVALEVEESEPRLTFGRMLLEYLDQAQEHVETRGEETSECVLCGEHTLNPEERRKVYAPLIEKRKEDCAQYEVRHQEKISERDASRADYDAEVAKNQQALDDVDFAIDNVETSISQTEKTIETFEGSLKDVPDKYEGMSSGELQQRIAEIRGADALRQQYITDKASMRELEIERSRAKSLEDEASNMLKTFLKNSAETAEKTVNQFMPDGFEAKLVVDDTVCEWRVIGADKRAHKKGAMAGSEEGALLIALALAWTEGSPIRVLCLDDRDMYAFSAKNVKKLLVTLREAVEENLFSQCLVSSSRPEEIPEGWFVVNVTADGEAVPVPPPEKEESVDAGATPPDLLVDAPKDGAPKDDAGGDDVLISEEPEGLDPDVLTDARGVL